MTAPLTQTYTEHASLRSTVYHLLDAIDMNHVHKVEQLLCEIMKVDMPEVSLQLFYNYAQKKERREVCAYFKTILLVTHNNH